MLYRYPESGGEPVEEVTTNTRDVVEPCLVGGMS